MLVNPIKRAYLALESWFNVSFGTEWNPVYHLGTLTFFLFWIILVTGLYLFGIFHGSIDGAYDSVEYITHEQWYVAGVMRSLHRYASDAAIITILLHLFKEFASGRYRGFRWFSWVSGLPILWLVVTLGITGYWLVWDELAQYVAIGSARLLDSLPIFSGSMASNFLQGQMTDRFFILIEFLHLLGQPLILFFLLWLHVKRISNVEINPPRGLAIGCFLALLVLSFIKPAVSHGPADLTSMPTVLNLDWFYLNAYPLMDLWSEGKTWMLATVITFVLMLLPWIPSKKDAPAAVVDLAHCNGCELCFDDCPFEAITVQARTDGAKFEKEVVVDPNLCASCGICMASCPSSNPFRLAEEELKTGIDMPALPVDKIRTMTEAAVNEMTGPANILMVGCEHGFNVNRLDNNETKGIKLMCSGMIPPTMVEYALKKGADGIMIVGCRHNDCFFRFGNLWVDKRFSGERKPILRKRADRRRIRVFGGSETDKKSIENELSSFRNELLELNKEVVDASDDGNIRESSDV
ncbi:MAG: hydrogenase iron-sulfur subunit [Gammaproteobacteria bacterium]